MRIATDRSGDAGEALSTGLTDIATLLVALQGVLKVSRRLNVCAAVARWQLLAQVFVVVV